MFFIIGVVVVFGSVIGGYMGAGGHLDVLWQPFEVVIIFGAGIGAFIISNPKTVLGGTAKVMGPLLRGGVQVQQGKLHGAARHSLCAVQVGENQG